MFRELLSLVCCGELRLLGLGHQLISFVEMPGRNGGFGARNEIARDWVLRVQPREPLHYRLVLLGNIGKRLRQLFEGDVLLADDP